ncbi:hypothetical protein ACLB2K_046240 [Fragaria x ananassa]
MVGIWGIGGIGKTTIAKELFNSFRHKFEGWCFLANVRAASVPHQGLVQLQNNLLNEILGGQKMEMTDADRGIQVIKDRLGSKRVLLVLDDVNELNQLDKLAGGLDWFGRGSRIIITTRDKGLLISHQVNPIYTAKALDDDEARNLLILNAFKGNKNPDECVKFPIDTAVRFAHCLPLAINILGSLLVGKDINHWHDVLKSYKRYPNRGIQKVLETSYSALEDHLKEVFLDIACFLKGKKKDYVMQALEDPYPAHALEVLEEKALINTETGRIWMHDLLEEMGKDIVHKESPIDAGRRSRVWFHEDVRRVLTENMGSNHVKGIRVELPGEDEICLSPKCFKKMKNLQLFININARFSGEVNYLPNQLRFLDWPGFPAQSLPSDFNPQKLVELNMRNSRISRLGEGLKNLQNLKSLSFRSCKFLTEVPDLSGRFPNLERLDLRGCTNLAELHHSVGSLENLVRFDLNGCNNLKMFPRIVKMKSLQYITFRGCKRLENFPEIVGRMESLFIMNVSGTAITEVPSSIGHQLYNLKELYLRGCENLTTLPLSIFELQHLLNLGLRGCPKLAPTPCSNNVEYLEASNSNISHYSKQISSDSDQGNLAFPSLSSLSISDCGFLVTLDCAPALRTLDLSFSNFVSLPAGLAKLIELKRLNLKECKNLQEVPELAPNLEILEVSGCVSLERISKLSSILKRQESQMFRFLDFSKCWRLYGNLVEEAEKEIALLVNDKIDNRHHHHEGKADLLSLVLSSQKSEFGIVFSASDEMLEWFSCRMGLEEDRVLYEYDIEVLPNFKWEDTGVTGLALCERHVQFKFEIRIDEVLVVTRHSVVSHGAWLQYIPFDGMDMSGFGYRRPVPPFRCRVSFHPDVYPGMGPPKSCGVHLVMPPYEECMKLNYKDSDVELGSSDANSELANSYRGEEGPSRLKKRANNSSNGQQAEK